MTDRELLERAAKAAGIEEFTYINGEPAYRFAHTGLQDWKRWNPLTDNGDALRLAVKLRLSIGWSFGGHGVTVDASNGSFTVEAFEAEYNDQSADVAIRRAIVRAAAAIREQTP